MCLILISYKQSGHYPLVLAANRDEYYDRPSSPAAFWEDAPHILAGRDLKDGGTWMGITRSGRLAALTNYRDPASVKNNAPSRGLLVKDFLAGNESPSAYLRHLQAHGDRYNGFGLIFGDSHHLHYYTNRGNAKAATLAPGLYGLSNHYLNTPWPKVEKGKKALRPLIDRRPLPVAEIFGLLMDKTAADDRCLPDTGVGLRWERILSPIFITSRIYGTRSSTVLAIDQKGQVTLVEKVFDAYPEPWVTAKFEFRIQSKTEQERQP
jgi:uncharacterized protein with NRDE domain